MNRLWCCVTILLSGILLNGCVYAVKPARLTYVNPYERSSQYHILGRGAVALQNLRNLKLYLPCLPQEKGKAVASPCEDPNGVLGESTMIQFCLLQDDPKPNADGWLEWVSAHQCERVQETQEQPPVTASLKDTILKVKFPSNPTKYGGLADKEIKLVRTHTKQELVKLWFWISTEADLADMLEK